MPECSRFQQNHKVVKDRTMPRNSRGRYRESDSDSEKFCKLFIGGLSYSTNEESMKEYFEPWGDVVDCVVMRDPNTKKSRGFGFITYKTEEQVDKAQCNRPHNIDNKEVETKRAMPRNETDSQITVKKLFVGGIKEDTTEEDIREFFSSKGKIESIDMITDKGTGKKRGFCFITFEDYDTVDKLVLRKYYDFKGKRIEVKKALSRAEMNHNKQANMNQMSGPMGPMGPGPHMGPMGPMGPGPHMGPPGPHGRGNRGGMGGGRGPGNWGGRGGHPGYGGGYGYQGNYGGGHGGYGNQHGYGGCGQGGWNQGGGYETFGGGYGGGGGSYGGGYRR
ncbi:heterogeneous nuclear ribonucleoprotein A3 isoform X5 [Octopus bimaculoides]|uniref:heterogeneous nuclear ribonucleoprotein A3 isoform X5 n=1 Tax=Octopus bimaculoides TaxID=37653 RepID=UPI00071DAC8F|nr:heterogeneous nuclear ribonucleoprotein A3 isoform X5 [Octopus bimaculoides]|eukprot:XP_014776457.1 PREDICTED: heterogeneous nuclear ribonucleoprotein A3-like isoform X5 [Octopus bimaculoides]